MRSVGYNAVSFRDLADDVKVKSASIHYYFPQKGDLGVELVERYTRRFKDRLDQIDTADLKAAITSFVDLYAGALSVGESMCLCAMLGAETNGLPPEVNDKVSAFFQMNIAWLSALNARHKRVEKGFSPVDIVSALEGAMIVSTSRKDKRILEKVIESILQDYGYARRKAARSA